MNKSIKFSFIIFVLTFVFNAHATNYVGLDYKFRSMKGKRTNTYSMREVLPKSYSGAEVYFSRRFDNKVGLNFGYEQLQNKAKAYTFTAGELFLGDSQNAGDRSNTKTRIKAFHFDVCGYFNQTDNFELLGQLGLSLMQAKINGTTTVGNVTRSMSASDVYKVVPHIGFGLQYFFGKNFGLRTLLGWEGTNMYRVKLTDEDGVQRKIKAFRQSWCLGLGIVGRF